MIASIREKKRSILYPTKKAMANGETDPRKDVVPFGVNHPTMIPASAPNAIRNRCCIPASSE